MPPTASIHCGEDMSNMTVDKYSQDAAPDMISALKSAIYHMEAELRGPSLPGNKRVEIESTVKTLKQQLEGIQAGNHIIFSQERGEFQGLPQTQGPSVTRNQKWGDSQSQRSQSEGQSPYSSNTNSSGSISSSSSDMGPGLRSRNVPSLFGNAGRLARKDSASVPLSTSASPITSGTNSGNGSGRYADFYIGSTDTPNEFASPGTSAASTKSDSDTPVIDPSSLMSANGVDHRVRENAVDHGHEHIYRDRSLNFVPDASDIVEISDEDEGPLRVLHSRHIDVPSQATTIVDDDDEQEEDEDDDDIQFQSMSIKSDSEPPFVPRVHERSSSLFNSHSAGKKREYSPVENSIDLTGEDDDEGTPRKTSGASLNNLVTSIHRTLLYKFLSEDEYGDYMRNVVGSLTTTMSRLEAENVLELIGKKTFDYGTAIRRFEDKIRSVSQRIQHDELGAGSSADSARLASQMTQKGILEHSLRQYREKFAYVKQIFNSVVYNNVRNFRDVKSKLESTDNDMRSNVEAAYFQNFQTNAGPSRMNSASGTHFGVSAAHSRGNPPYGQVGLPGLNGVFQNLGPTQRNTERGASLFNQPRTSYESDTYGPPMSEKDLEDLINNIQQNEEVKPEDRIGTPPELSITLLEHQKVGLSWLQNKEDGRQKAGILADDMGLGKTIQVL
ncbi:translocase ULS1 [Sugiyamaella lignohabitans]|uniref:Translocase ULS1 n=1 Tax=Sugiyamaella lignohabitans TaxID=796027 RepID=A0A167DVG6_9ASCO|nr:translocase ULS1 [Sugiyamaella lignohabitans]ANB13341.1 translocase ULS1 [Sugiyamaella lignohabitans]